MDFNKIKTQLLAWMTNFIEQPNPGLGNWAPCPYARAARISNKILILDSDADKLAQTVQENLDKLNAYEVIVICFDHTLLLGQDCARLTAELNQELMKQDVVILEDHPDLVEYVSTIKMNFGLCGLYVVQQLSKLNEATQKLQAAGYYDHWSNEELDEVVTWRHK